MTEHIPSPKPSTGFQQLGMGRKEGKEWKDMTRAGDMQRGGAGNGK